ncbi:hypothetical protein L208DRAFT_1460228 [Tricholoma matsutake]|nr:hypothetical protein L208DRAFT_1460228 [Tricholoma matsutake 945]
MPNSGKEKQFIELRLLRPIQDRCLKIFNRSPSPRPISDTGLQDNVVRTSLSTSQNTSGTSAIQEPSVTTSSTATSSASDDHNLQYNEYTAIGGLPTTPPGPSTPGQRMKDGGGVAYEGLKAVAQALYNCSDMFLPLKAAVGVFLEVTKVVDRVSGNKKELADLQSKLEAILSIVQKYQRYGGLRALDHRIEIFCQAITAQSEAVRKLQAHHVSTRAAEGAKDADTILKALCNVNNLCDVLQIDTQLHIEVAVEDIGGNVEDIDGNVKEILQRLTSGTIDRLRHEMTSYKTRHSSYGDPSGCMLGTRIQILADLDAWASDEGSSKVYWMVGMAGTGKSTVSQTLCENLDKKNMLGASFFCSRASDKANNARLIIPAIAHSLAKTSPSVRSEVVKAIESDERLMESTYSNLKDQFEKLICQPIRKAIGQSIKTYKTIVIDAVDECTDLRLASSLIQLILSSVSDLPLKIFIASREETPIHNAFHSYPKVWTPLYLHEVKEDVIKHDIHQYLETSLSDIKNCFPGDNSNAWPSPSDISMLLDRCGTLFIYASTVIRYINDIDGNYWYRLSVMTSSSSKSASHLQTDPLYDLYGQILERANESKDPDEVCQISQLLSTVVFLQNPLTVQAIGSLLAMEISASLSPLRSVIHVSTNKQATVAPFHASFTDFITDPTHCSPKRCPSFAALVASEGHTMLALNCLQHMNCKLKYNICGVPDELTVSRREKRNLPENMSKISEALKYSCLYWASHLAKAEVFATELVTALDCFLRKHLLHWIECLSVLNELQTGLKCLGSASTALSLSKNIASKSITLHWYGFQGHHYYAQSMQWTFVECPNMLWDYPTSGIQQSL